MMKVSPEEILEIKTIDKNLPEPMPVWASTGDYETNFVAQVSINLILQERIADEVKEVKRLYYTVNGVNQ